MEKIFTVSKSLDIQSLSVMEAELCRYCERNYRYLAEIKALGKSESETYKQTKYGKYGEFGFAVFDSLQRRDNSIMMNVLRNILYPKCKKNILDNFLNEDIQQKVGQILSLISQQTDIARYNLTLSKINLTIAPNFQGNSLEISIGIVVSGEIFSNLRQQTIALAEVENSNFIEQKFAHLFGQINSHLDVFCQIFLDQIKQATNVIAESEVINLKNVLSRLNIG